MEKKQNGYIIDKNFIDVRIEEKVDQLIQKVDELNSKLEKLLTNSKD